MTGWSPRARYHLAADQRGLDLLRVGLGEALEYRAFLDANPAWPDRNTLNQRLDEALFTRGGTPRAIKELYKGNEPRTAAGYAALLFDS